jgi:hypothetical protein
MVAGNDENQSRPLLRGPRENYSDVILRLAAVDGKG